MTSKQVVDRARSAAKVAASLETHAAEIGSALDALLTPHLARGERMPDIALLMRLLGRTVKQRSSALDEVDRAHEAEQADDAAPRADRDAAEREVRDMVVSFRQTVSASFGDDGLRALGLWDAPPSDPRGLERYASSFASALKDESRKLPSMARRGVKLDRAEMAAELEPQLTLLGKALASVMRESAELDATQTAKDKALAANDVAFVEASRIAEAMMTLVGRPELATRLRPSVRRPGISQEDESPAPTPATGT